MEDRTPFYRQLLNTEEAATHLGLKPCTLRKWRVYGGGPSFCYVGRRVRYTLKDIEGFTAKTFKNTAQAKAAKGD